MRDRDRKREQFVVDKYRFDNTDIVVVRTAIERIIKNINITGAQLIAEFFKDHCCLNRECAGKNCNTVRLGDELARGVTESASEIEHLIDNGAHGATL